MACRGLPAAMPMALALLLICVFGPKGAFGHAYMKYPISRNYAGTPYNGARVPSYVLGRARTVRNPLPLPWRSYSVPGRPVLLPTLWTGRGGAGKHCGRQRAWHAT